MDDFRDDYLPIEEEWDTARFGEDPRAGNAAAAGGGQGGGGQGGGGGGGEGGGGQGGGGGGDGGSAGAIAQAAAAIVGMVIGVVQYEDQPPTIFLRATVKLANALAGLQRCLQEYGEADATYREHKAWVSDPAHWQPWKKAGKAHDPLKFCNDSKTPPEKLCAFRDPVRATDHVAWKKAFEDPTRGILHCIREGFGTCGGAFPSDWTPRLTATEDVFNPNIRNMGSVEQYRRYATRYHEQVLGLDVYREFFLAAGLPLPTTPGVATETAALKAMYPQPEYKADIDRGVLPFSMRNKLLGQALNLYRMDLVPGGFSLPLYLYDLSPAQQRATVFAPTMAQVADFAASRATPRQMGAGREQGAVTDVSADLGQWIQAGMPQQWGGRALSRPLPSPAAILADVPAPVKPTFREAHPRLFWTGVAAGAVAGTGTAVWAGLKLAGR